MHAATVEGWDTVTGNKNRLGMVCGAVAVLSLLGFVTYLVFGKKEVNEVYEYQPEDVVFEDESGHGYVSGVVTVWFTPSSGERERDAAVKTVDGEVVGRMDAYDQYQVRVDAETEDDLESICAILEREECVSFATLDRVTTSEAIPHLPNDPFNGDPVDYTNPYAIDGDYSRWPIYDVDAHLAWSFYDEGMLGNITLGVVDNGFDVSHKDFGGRVSYFSEADASYRNVANHGTHVAGIMAASMDNNEGIAGIDSTATVLCFDAARYVGSDSKEYFRDSDLLIGLYETVNAGAKVINFSVGCKGLASEREIADEGRMYSRAVGALLHHGHDFVVVQSAGNSGVEANNNLLFAAIDEDNCNEDYVAKQNILDRILIVASVERHYTSDDDYSLYYADYSNGGATANIAAPGTEVLSTIPDDGYEYLTGTSMSAPSVTGICGLVWSAAPKLTGADVSRIVRNNGGYNVITSSNFTESRSTTRIANANLAVMAALEETGKLSRHESEIRLCQAFLMELIDGSVDFYDGRYVIYDAFDLTSSQMLHSFAVGDMDRDGKLEVFVVSEQLGDEYGAGSGVFLYSVFHADHAGNFSRVVHTGALSKPDDVRFWHNQAIEIVQSTGAGYAQGGRSFMGSGELFYKQIGISDDTLLEFSPAADGESPLPDAEFSYYTSDIYAVMDMPQYVSRNDWNAAISQITKGGELGIKLQPFTEKNVRELTAKKVPVAKQESVDLPHLYETWINGGNPDLSAEENPFLGAWVSDGGTVPLVKVTILESGNAVVEHLDTGHLESSTWVASENPDYPSCEAILVDCPPDSFLLRWDLQEQQMFIHYYEAESRAVKVAE